MIVELAGAVAICNLAAVIGLQILKARTRYWQNRADQTRTKIQNLAERERTHTVRARANRLTTTGAATAHYQRWDHGLPRFPEPADDGDN